MKRSNWSPKHEGTGLQAEESVKPYLSAFDADDYGAAFPAVKRWIHDLEAYQQSRQEKRAIRWFHVLNVVERPGLKLAYLMLLIVVLAGASAVPVEQTMPLGHILQWQANHNPEEALQALGSLDWIGQHSLSISSDDTQSYTLFTLILPGSSPDDMQAWTARLQTITGSTELDVRLLEDTISRPLYQVVLQSFSVHVHVADLSEAEIQQRIHAQLSASGINNAQVEHTTQPDGQNKIEINVPVPE